MKFTERTTKPEAGNKYYIRNVNGGWSPCIQGSSPTDPDCNVLPNCVGYAVGRFSEIGGYGYCKYFANVNAENFMQYKGNLETGQTPKLGACMVWQSGATLSGADGCGHVAIVERVISDTEVLTSESVWGGSAFRNVVRKKGSDGRWGMGSNYKFLGFIYNPAPCCQGDDTDTDTNAAPAPTGADSNKIYRSLGTAAKRKGASTNTDLAGRCDRGGYYIASQIVTASNGQQWLRHAGTDLYSALTDNYGAGPALFEECGTYTTGVTNAPVNVRVGAGLDKEKITLLEAGVTVYLTGKTAEASDTTWIEVIYNERLAWMAKVWVDC